MGGALRSRSTTNNCGHTASTKRPPWETSQLSRFLKVVPRSFLSLWLSGHLPAQCCWCTNTEHVERHYKAWHSGNRDQRCRHWCISVTGFHLLCSPVDHWSNVTKRVPAPKSCPSPTRSDIICAVNNNDDDPVMHIGPITSKYVYWYHCWTRTLNNMQCESPKFQDYSRTIVIQWLNLQPHLWQTLYTCSSLSSWRHVGRAEEPRGSWGSKPKF